MKIRSRKMRAAAALAMVGLVLLSAACGPKRLAQMNIQDPDKCLEPVVGGGLQLCAKAIFNGVECESYYGINILKKGYLPVQVSLVNQGQTPMALRLESFSLSYHGSELAPVPPDVVYKDLKASVGGRTAGWGIAFGVIGGVAAYSAAKSRNEALNSSLYTHEFVGQNLTAGQNVKAVLYFPLPDKPGAEGATGTALHLVLPAGATEATTLSVDLKEPAKT